MHPDRKKNKIKQQLMWHNFSFTGLKKHYFSLSKFMIYYTFINLYAYQHPWLKDLILITTKHHI